MTRSAPAGPAADRNLLFGVLALQADFLDPARFVEACSAWGAHKDIRLADLLVERGWLTPADRADVERFLDRKLKKHNGDVQAGLAEVSTAGVRHTLAFVADPVVQQSLATVPPSNAVLDKPTLDYQPAGRDRYTLTRLHAKGGMGQVWVARDKDLGREVALKELQGDRAADDALLSRFVEEAKVTGQLEHPNIVPVYELARPAGEGPFYTMRFVRGRTLESGIQVHHQKRKANEAGRLDLRELLSQFMAVCNAVAYAHSRGVLHRDLKPGNVVVGNFGEVIVLDWGLAKLKGTGEPSADLLPVSVGTATARGATVQGQMLGTPSYMPPEQAEGRFDLVDERSDVYGLGAILYELLTGEPPFSGADTLTIIARVVADLPVPPRQRVGAVPRALEAICLKALAKRQADRYESAGELSQEVQRWLADEPVMACVEPWTARTARWARRHRVLVAGCVAALLVATAALAVTAAVVGGKNAELAGKNAALAQANDRERQTAERAQRTIEDMTSEEALKFLETQKELRPEQRRFLEQALAYYRKATQEQAAAEADQARQAGAYRNMGRLQERLGLLAEAEAAYRAALEEYASLTADHPLEAQYRHGLARSHLVLGSLLADLGTRPEDETEYRAALKEFEHLTADDPQAPEYREGLARTRHGLGVLLSDEGKRTDSEAEYRAALKEYDRLAAEHPKAAEYRCGLARSHNALGNLLDDMERRADAVVELGSARKEFEGLASEFPREAEFLQGLARAHSNLGVVLGELRKYSDAEIEYRSAIKGFERLTAEFPLVLRYRADLGVSHNNLGDVLNIVGKWPEAEAEYRAGHQEYARAATDERRLPEYQQLMAQNHANLGELLRGMGRRAEAEAEYGDALKLYEQLRAEHPEVPGYAASLGRTCCGLGNLASDGGQPTKAMEWYARATAALEGALQKLGPDPDARQYLRDTRLGRAIARAQLGQHAEATAEAEELLKADSAHADPPDGGFYFDASRVFARSAAKVEDAGLAERCAVRAVALLQQGQAAAYFENPAHLQRLQGEKDFDSLRSRADFKKFLAEVEAKAPKPK